MTEEDDPEQTEVGLFGERELQQLRAESHRALRQLAHLAIGTGALVFLIGAYSHVLATLVVLGAGVIGLVILRRDYERDRRALALLEERVKRLHTLPRKR